MSVHVKIVVDNNTQQDSYTTEHGLCVYVETATHKCLVDVGASDKFATNAEKMGIDISDIDYVFLSHGHLDHVGGLPYFLAHNAKAKIVHAASLFTQRYFSTRNTTRDISLDYIFTEEQLARFIPVSVFVQIEKDISILPHICQKFPLPKGNKFLFTQSGNKEMERDIFDHEIVVCFGTTNLLVCSGCAHNGLLNILHTVEQELSVPIRAVVGGFHLLDTQGGNTYEMPEEVEEIANVLQQKYPATDFYTGHCTGNNAIEILKQVLNERLSTFFCGWNTTLEN